MGVYQTHTHTQPGRSRSASVISNICLIIALEDLARFAEETNNVNVKCQKSMGVGVGRDKHKGARVNHSGS